MLQHLPNEKELLCAVSSGDETAFRILFDSFKIKLYNYIFSITKSKQITEELLQDVFVKIWLHKEMLGEINNFDSYLFTMARNRSIDYLRKMQSGSQLQVELLEEINKVSGSTADAPLQYKEAEQKIEAIVKKLSPQRQLVFRLSREEGLNHEQIALRLNLSKSTVKNHLVEALKTIRQAFDNPSRILLLFVFYKFLCSH